MPKESIKKRSVKGAIPLKKSNNNEHINWLKFLEPKSIEDLIVHPKKIEDIKQWFSIAQKSTKNRILLLNGPSGCAKLTTIKIIAAELDYSVVEWISKSFIDWELLTDEGDVSYNYKKESDAFQEYLLKSSRFNSVFSQKDRLLVVKDFPNIFLRNGNEQVFWNILKKFKATGTSPLIFILTDTNSKSLNIEYNLFPDILRNQLGIDVINMNPISMTMMKKTLKQICGIMKENMSLENPFVEPTQSVIDDIIAQSQGDIRNGIMNLQMVCQQGSINLSLSTKSKVKKSGKTIKAPIDKINKGVGRDEVLGIFHGVGRALHPKKEQNEETMQMKLTHNPEAIADCFSSQSGNYIELLHSNYLKNFSCIDDVCKFSNILALSDVFQKEYRNADRLHYLNLCLIIRGAMVWNNKPTKGFRPITGYANKKFKNVEENSFQGYLNNSINSNNDHRISIRDYFLDYNCYLKFINTFKK